MASPPEASQSKCSAPTRRRTAIWSTNVAFVICSVLQRILYRFSLVPFQKTPPEFTTAAYLMMLLVSISLLMALSIPVVFAEVYYGGFLPEARYSHVVISGMAVCGLLNALGRTMQAISASNTSLGFQLTSQHLVVPFSATVALTLSRGHRTRFTQTLSQGISCLMILLGVLLHLSFAYISETAPTNLSDIFSHVVYFISAIPFALSAVTQQECYTIRRINVFYFLFHTSVYQLGFQVLLFPFTLLKGVGTLSISRVSQTYKTVATCFVKGSSTYTSNTVQNAPLNCNRTMLPSYLLLTVASQVLQISVVRQNSYIAVAILILCISLGACLFEFFISLDVIQPIMSIFGGVIPEEHDGFSAATHNTPASPSALMIYAIVIIGDALYRLRPAHGLKHDFALDRDIRFSEDREVYQLFAPFLQVENESHRPLPTPDVTVPFYLPSPIPHHRSLPQRVFPSLMNPWSGDILCEYTDYKRWNDCSTTPAICPLSLDSLEEGPDCRAAGWLSALNRTPPSYNAAVQYTCRHLQTLQSTEEALRKLYAYHNLGTLAASMAAASRDASVFSSASRSSSSQSSPGRRYQRKRRVVPGLIALETSPISSRQSSMSLPCSLCKSNGISGFENEPERPLTLRDTVSVKVSIPSPLSAASSTETPPSA